MSSNVKRQNAKGFIELKQSERVEFIVFNRFWLNQEENEEPMDACCNGRHFSESQR